MAQRDASSGQFAKTPAVTPPPAEQLTATQTGDQSGFTQAVFEAFGGGQFNPCQFPGYGSLYPGTYQTYRWMLNHPVNRFARAIATVPLVNNTWAIEPNREGLPARAEGWKKHLEDCILPQRRQLIRMGIHSLDMGCSFGEKIWDVRDSRYWVKVKWLSNDITEIVTDRGGNVAGLSQGFSTLNYVGTTEKGERIPGLGAYKHLLLTNDFTPEVGPYGRSRLESIRDYAWKPWLEVMQDLKKLGGKLSGILGLLFGPAGSFTDARTGETVRWSDMAKAAGRALMNNQFGYFPTMALAGADAQGRFNVDQAAALSKVSTTRADFYDAGNHAPAISGFLSLLDHYEGLMFNGWLRSVRTGRDTKGASRADAEVHTDTGVEDSEAIDDDIAEQISSGLVDDVLVLNYGEEARGAFKVTAPPLVSGKMSQLREFMRLLMGNPTLAVAIAKSANVNEVMKSLDIPQVADFKTPDAVPPTNQTAMPAEENRE